MKIDEIGSEKKSQGLGDSSRQAEVQRLAQSMAAERMASAAAAGAAGQAVAPAGQIQEDSIKLSSKALNEVSARNSADSLNRRDDLLSSLMEKLNSEILNPDSEFNKQNEKKAEAGGGGGADKNKNKKQAKTEAEWQPKTDEGQIHPGRDVIGQVKITTEAQEGGGEGGGGAVGAVGGAGASKANTKGGTPNYGKAAESKPSQEQGSKQNGDSKDENKEAKESSAAQSLEKAGLKAEGLEQGGKSSPEKSKSEEQAGGAGGGGVEVRDVRTRATGATQTLEVTPPKKLQSGEGLRKFRKLDDKPLLKYATMHKQDFAGDKDAIKELKKNAQAAGESPEAIQQAVQQLKERSQPDS